MAVRWFTGDFHLGTSSIIEYASRPFSSVSEMNSHLLCECAKAAPDDTIIHVGDFALFGNDRHGTKCINSRIRQEDVLSKVKATFINIRGNHDLNNKVKSLCDSMRTRLGRKYTSVSISHYPTYDPHAKGHFQHGDIHLCGHVHGKWRCCLDVDSMCLNINVGVDAWNYKLVKEETLINYVNFLIRQGPDKIFRCKSENGKLVFSEYGKI